MDFITIFFSILSLIMIVYLGNTMISQKRTNLLSEIFFTGIYIIVLLIFLFPNILRTIEAVLGIPSAINFIVYLSIFVAFGLLFTLYKKSEKHRIEITKLTREIAYLKNGKNKSK